VTQYRIVRLAGLHTPVAEIELLNHFPDFLNWSYDEQMASLFQLKYLYSDSFSRSIRNLGQEAFDIVWDLELVQKQWATENGIDTSSDGWQTAVLIDQLRTMQPEVVYFQGTELAIPGRPNRQLPSINWPVLIKQEIPSVKLVMMYSGFPSRGDRITGVDILLSGPPHVVDHYKRMGYKPILCYHAFDSEVLESLAAEDQKSAALGMFTFVGSARAPESRYWILKQLMRNTDINVWIDEPPAMGVTEAIKSSWVSTLSVVRNILSENIKKYRKLNTSNSLLQLDSLARVSNRWLYALPARPLKSMYPSKCHGAVRGLEYYRVLQQSKITFNKHTDHVYDSVGNMRMFEATGVGTCLLTDSGSNIRDLFEPDAEVVTYSSSEEAIEKAKFLLENEETRMSIAKNGNTRTLKDHTIENRCNLVDEIIQRSL